MNSPFTQDGDLNEDSSFNEAGVSPEFLKLLEASVLDAGKYVVPSDDLRPHTLEAARELDTDRKETYSLTKVAVAFAVCGFLCLPVFSRMASWRDRVSAPNSLHMFEAAQKKNIGLDWGLFEAFNEARQRQASQFGKTGSKNIRE
jgi:hypothetical protein